MKINFIRAAIAVFLIVFSGLTVFAQQTTQPAKPTDFYTPAMMAEMQKLQKSAIESDYALKQTAYLTNNIGARLSGSKQAARAVEYVAAEMRKLGLEVTLEKVMVPQWVRGTETGALVKYPGQAAPDSQQKIVLTALGGSVATPAAGMIAEVIVVNNFDELTALGRDKVAGRIVLFNVPFDKQLAAQGFAGEAYGQVTPYRGGGASAAARLGATAMLVRSVGSADFRLPHTGAMNYAMDAPKIPAAAVTAEDADLIAHLATQGKVEMQLVLTAQTMPDVESYNVIADLKGSERPEEIVIVSGHLDSWDLGTGAIDDATGVAASMDAVRLIKQAGLRPRRTIRMIAWMNEENGLRGARTYATNRQDALKNHFAAIEMDGGAGHPTGFAARADAQMIEMLRPVSQILRSAGAGVIRPIESAAGADLIPLDAAGVPTFAPLSDSRTYFHYHHTAADTFDKVVPQELAENTAVITVLAFALANLPDQTAK